MVFKLLHGKNMSIIFFMRLDETVGWYYLKWNTEIIMTVDSLRMNLFIVSNVGDQKAMDVITIY